MESAAVAIFLGVIVILLGAENRKGNISSLHWYHRHRIREDDRLAFGKQVGTGTIIIGVSLILMGVFFLLAELLEQEIFTAIGSVLLLAGLIPGIGISLHAMIKYNGGIF